MQIAAHICTGVLTLMFAAPTSLNLLSGRSLRFRSITPPNHGDFVRKVVGKTPPVSVNGDLLLPRKQNRNGKVDIPLYQGNCNTRFRFDRGNADKTTMLALMGLV